MIYFDDYKEFYNVFKLAAEGDIDATKEMLNYLTLLTADSNDTEMIRMLKATFIDRLVDESSSVGWIKKGDYIIENLKNEEDLKSALKCYLRGAMMGDTFGFDMIGETYYKGIAGEPDYEMAWIFFWLSIEYSNVPNALSLCRIGQMFKYGQRVDINEDDASFFLSKAIEVAGEYADVDDYALLAKKELAELV
ncbi:sel1 repeat family protein [Pseudobutyrivibrio sp. LB2011]|uniref:sel1 repeat family protein n=1 Tax=Pseudobutyrivibrio sp. LB2011 TaxID=1408312 RepID=UPI0005D20794|nr:sel1 repeat family protein [Pseudobutyrivibrio sp. LB2011]